MRTAAAAIGIWTMFGFSASAEIFEGVPDVMVCHLPATGDRAAADLALYAAQRYEDGSVLYRPLGKSHVTATRAKDGTIDAGPLRSCRFPETDKDG